MTILVTVSHRGRSHSIACLATDTIGSFQSRLTDLTAVPVANQKFLYKGKKTSHSDQDTIEQVGLRDGIKVQMLGSTAEEIGGMRVVEDEVKEKERIMKERDEKYRRSKVRSLVHQTLCQY